MSKLTNIDQIRAASALNSGFKKEEGEGDNLSGFPSLIINNGLIAAIAFAVDKGDQHERIAAAIAEHLTEQGIVANARSATALRDALCRCSASTLQRATREALAFLSYLKRFKRT